MSETENHKGSWRPVAALVLVALGQVGLYVGVLHRSRPEIEALWREGDSRQRAWALHVLSNRGDIDADDFDAPFMRELLSDEDLFVREMAFTNDLCKMRPPELQKEYLAEYIGDDAHFLRSWILMKRKVGGAMVGGGLKIARKELEWLFMVENGIIPPLEEMQEHFSDRALLVGVRKGFVDPETGEITAPPGEIDNF